MMLMAPADTPTTLSSYSRRSSSFRDEMGDDVDSATDIDTTPVDDSDVANVANADNGSRSLEVSIEPLVSAGCRATCRQERKLVRKACKDRCNELPGMDKWVCLAQDDCIATSQKAFEQCVSDRKCNTNTETNNNNNNNSNNKDRCDWDSVTVYGVKRIEHGACPGLIESFRQGTSNNTNNDNDNGDNDGNDNDNCECYVFCSGYTGTRGGYQVGSCLTSSTNLCYGEAFLCSSPST